MKLKEYAMFAVIGFTVGLNILAPVSAAAADVFLTTERRRAPLQVDDTMTVAVNVRGAPSVYGVELALRYDPTRIEVLDADDGKTGVQVLPGDFIADEKRLFVVRNSVDSKGSINYILTRLNPAAPEAGSGVLARMRLRMKQEGDTALCIETAKFGTREGTVVLPTIKTPELMLSVCTPQAAALVNGRHNMFVLLSTACAFMIFAVAALFYRHRHTRRFCSA